MIMNLIIVLVLIFLNIVRTVLIVHIVLPIIDMEVLFVIYGIYSMRDKHTGFVSPTFDLNDQSAARNFSMALTKSDGVLGFAPSDFDLYRLGIFDTDSGVITPVQLPELILTGSNAFLSSVAKEDKNA